MASSWPTTQARSVAPASSRTRAPTVRCFGATSDRMPSRYRRRCRARYSAITTTLALSMNSLPPAVTYGRIEPRKKLAASSIRRATSPDDGLASSVRRSTSYWLAQPARTFWIFVSVCGSPQIRACGWSVTRGHSNAPAPPPAPPRPLPEALCLGRGARRQEPHLALQVEQLLVGIGLHLERLELLDQGVARQILVHFGRGDQLSLLVLDLLRHLLERFERALVADRGHRFLDALVRLGAFLARDQDVLLALRFLDAVVELAQRDL